jgi:hypothetical protein
MHPCDVCHEKSGDGCTPGTWANRMICGLCSVEQAYRSESALLPSSCCACFWAPRAGEHRLLGVLDWSSNRQCKCGATFGSGASKTHWEVRPLPRPRPPVPTPPCLPVPPAAMRARLPAFGRTSLPVRGDCKRHGFTGTREARDAGTRPRCPTRIAASMQARPRLFRARPWPRKTSSCQPPTGDRGIGNEPAACCRWFACSGRPRLPTANWTCSPHYQPAIDTPAKRGSPP